LFFLANENFSDLFVIIYVGGYYWEDINVDGIREEEPGVSVRNFFSD
jgi:hypothetical protein